VEDLEGRRIATPFPEAIAAYKSWLCKRSVTFERSTPSRATSRR
jgi:hypothetical protein